MDRRKKEKDVFIALANKQLEPFDVIYPQVKDNPNWCMEYRTTEEKEQEFIEWGTELIRKELGLTKQAAKMEMNWFILQWGFPTTVAGEVQQSTVNTQQSKKLK